MADRETNIPARQLIRDVTEDIGVLVRASAASAAVRGRQILDEERRIMSAVVLRAILSLPILIMATLFAGAAVIEWLAGLFPMPLATVYGLAALCFALLATVILLWPRRQRGE